MAQFKTNVTRPDAYKNFKFRVRWEGRIVAGISKVSMVERATELGTPRERGDRSSSRKLPGRRQLDAITLERGVTYDAEFAEWANKVYTIATGLGAERSPRGFRTDMLLEVYNEAGQLAVAYKIFRAWVSEYQAVPDCDANANAVAIERLKLESEGWERDHDVEATCA